MKQNHYIDYIMLTLTYTVVYQEFYSPSSLPTVCCAQIVIGQVQQYEIHEGIPIKTH